MNHGLRLLEPIRLGGLDLPNRVFMSPLTRCRASAGRVPNLLMRDYYVQRASAGLILSEATAISPMAVGYPDTPGIWSPEQVQGWKTITEAVHAAGGWFLNSGTSAAFPTQATRRRAASGASHPARGHLSLLRPKRPLPPRALATDELPGIVDAYRRSRKMPARRRGVESTAPTATCSTNSSGQHQPPHRRLRQPHRKPRPAHARSHRRHHRRLGAGPDRHAPAALRFPTWDSDPAATFGYVAGNWQTASPLSAPASPSAPTASARAQKAVRRPRRQQAHTRDTADNTPAGEADAVAFGKLFIANPDLPRRFALNAPLNTPVPETFYASDPGGYTDYPALPPTAA